MLKTVNFSAHVYHKFQSKLMKFPKQLLFKSIFSL